MLRIVILVIALGAGTLAAWLALSLKPGVAVTTVEVAAPPVPMVDVLVASTDLAQGQAVSEANVRWQPWPETAINPGFVTRSSKPDAIKAFTAAMVRSHFVAGEPIRQEKLSLGSSSLLAGLLPPGKRAVAIRISVESTAGGFILPNDRVDVIQTVARPGEGQTENLSRTILTNIRVLAVDQKVDEAKGQAVAMGKTATLELSPAQAETIAAGQASGILSLSLRSFADSDEVPIVTRPSGGYVRIFQGERSEMVRF